MGHAMAVITNTTAVNLHVFVSPTNSSDKMTLYFVSSNFKFLLKSTA